jgi:hypothetical protein
MLISIFKTLVQNQEERPAYLYSLISNRLYVINFFLKTEKMHAAFLDGENNGV